MFDQILVFAYLLGILLLGLWSGRKISNMEEFAVAGRSFTSLVIFATLSASFIGGGFSIGNAEKVFLIGVINIFALWGFSLKEIMVATFIAPRMDRFRNAISVGDIMKEDYGLTGKVVTGVFSLLLCAGIVGAQVGGIGIVFHVFLGLPQTVGILIGCGIVITYTTVGGMRAIIFTDLVQFVVLAVAMPLTLYMGIQHVGGWDSLRETLPAAHFQLPGDGLSLLAFVSLFLTFFLGETLVPPYMQRLYIGKNAQHTARGT
jgi:SSS family solute:Na+ symporter